MVFKYIFLMVILVASRFLPMPPNFSPLYGVAMGMGNAKVPWYGFVLFFFPILFISDYFIGYHVTYLFVAISFFLQWGIGSAFALSTTKSIKEQWGAVLGVPFLGACVFFIVSNLGVWLTGTSYPLTLSGLISCFSMAVPFFPQTLVSSVIGYMAVVSLERYFARIVQKQAIA